MPVSDKSIQNLIAGKNRKIGSTRTNVVLSGPAKAIAALKGNGKVTEGIEQSLLENATLADKVRLIAANGWMMPFSDTLPDQGWEGIDYFPSRLVVKDMSLTDFFEYGTSADISDPLQLERMLERFGVEAICELAKGYDLEGNPNA